MSIIRASEVIKDNYARGEKGEVRGLGTMTFDKQEEKQNSGRQQQKNSEM